MEEDEKIVSGSEEHVIFIDRLVDFPNHREKEKENKSSEEKKEEKVE